MAVQGRPPGLCGALTLILGTLLFSSQLALAQFSQQGPKLVGMLASVFSNQGWSVAVSADGDTAIVGGPSDNSFAGAAWVFTRSGGVWTQQGNKLGGYDAVGMAFQGLSVALSADGNTAIVGGPGDASGAGAAWVFTRSGGVWTQQGSKLVGTGAVGSAAQGSSVALSHDGNTAIVGGPNDNINAGAAWVFTRSGGVWTQQDSKLVGTGVTGSALQGFSVALSGDGRTAIVGGPDDDVQYFDDGVGSIGIGVGAVWIFTRSKGVWNQQGGKLVGTGAISGSEQGSSVALSRDGNTAIVGGQYDNPECVAVVSSNGTSGSCSFVGAVWAFTRSGGVWTQQGSKLVGTGAAGSAAQGRSVALSHDGNTAIVGGPNDNSNAGAAWVFTRSGGVWTQQDSSWSVPARLGTPSKAGPSRCPPRGTPPSWAACLTTRSSGRRGSLFN